MRPYACFALVLLGGCAGNQARSAAPAPVVVVAQAPKTDKARDGTVTQKAPSDPHLSLQRALEQAMPSGKLEVLGTLGAGDDVISGIEGGIPNGELGRLGLGGSLGGGGIGIGTLGSGGGVVGGMLGGTGESFGYGGLGLRGIGSIRAKPRIEEATVTGPLAREIVQRVASDHLDDVEDCYALEATRSSPRGRIMLAFTIDATGCVTEVRVPESAQGMHELPSCIGQMLGTWKFPPPTGGSEVKVILPVSI